MAKDAGKRALYARILQEIQKFSDPDNEQRLSLITKKLMISKQQLNYYLQRFLKLGLLEKDQDYPYAIYKITAKGQAVKENLIQSEPGVKTVTWRYHNLIGLYKIITWGSWHFNSTKRVPMNNWTYQMIKAPNGLQLHVQDTSSLKIIGPIMYGPDGEELRIRASAMVHDAARWFADHYGAELGDLQVRRKGQKELLESGQLAKLLGRVKTSEFWVDASGGEENLEEYDDSFALEHIMEIPERLQDVQEQVKEIVNVMRGFMPQQVAISNALNYSATSIKNQTEILAKMQENVAQINERLSSGTQEPYPSREGDRGSERVLRPQIPGKLTLEDYSGPPMAQIEFIRATPKFRHPFRGAERIVGPFTTGARIWLPADVAGQVVRDGYAKWIREDRAGKG